MYQITTATKKIASLKKKIRAVQGGCLGIGTKILMYDLTYKKVEDIVVGDKLMGIDSKPRNVLRLYRGNSPLFKVKQKKGLDYIVNDKHILILEEKSKEIRKNFKRQSDGKWIRKYNGCKRNSGLNKFVAEDFYNGSSRSTIRRYKGIKTGLLFDKQPVKLDPYYLGLWLGDGTSRNASITNVDEEVLDYLYNELPLIYDVFVDRKDRVTTKITKQKGKYNEIITGLKHYNLILNKHIPIEYIRNDRQTRLKLLAGLIDSDGCLVSGYVITQKRKQLAEDILLLCRTLGFYATFNERVSKMKRKDGTVYECNTYIVSIYPKDYTEIPVRIPRKKSSMINYKNPLASSIELEKQDNGDYYGFELDGDHLFLLEDFTITHNTSSSKTISILIGLIEYAQKDEKPTLTSVVSESVPHLKKGAIRDFKNILKEHNYWKENNWSKSDNIYTFESGSQIEFFGADQADKLRGGRRDRLFINECNNVSFEAFEELEVRTKEFVYLDWNPVAEFWFDEEVKGKRDDVDFIILNYMDNEAIPEEIKKSIEQRRGRKGWWQVYGLGLLGEVEGKIYKDWQIIDELPHEARLERYGLDFGYTNDPTAIIAIYYYNGGYILDEIVYQKGMLNSEIASVLKNQPRALVVADSAEPKSIDEIKMAGITIIPSEKGRGSIKHGINIVQEQKISITKRSVNLIKEYRNYLWKTDRDGRVLNEPEDIYNHCFVGDTEIKTSKGIKKIKNMKTGELVLTRSGFKMVLAKHNNGIKRVGWYEIELSTGDKIEIRSTLDHKFYTTTGEKEIQNLQKDDVLYILNDKLSSIVDFSKEQNEFIEKYSEVFFISAYREVKINQILKKGESDEEVFDLTIHTEPEYYANGILVHNCMDAIRYGMTSLIPIIRKREYAFSVPSFVNKKRKPNPAR